jgi:DNA polymerase II small subunit
MRSIIINYAKDKNVIITEEGLRLLNINNYKIIIDQLQIENKIFIKPEDIKQKILDNNLNNDYQKEDNISKNKKANFYILDKYDVTGKNLSQGKVEDFHKLFLDKYKVLSEIIKTRENFNFTTIESAKREPKNKDVDIIGMVYEKRLTQKGNLMLTVDDPSGKIRLVIVNKDEKIFLKMKEILLDNVLGFKCVVMAKDILICNEVIYPDIPYINKISTVKEDTFAAIIGDEELKSGDLTIRKYGEQKDSKISIQSFIKKLKN